MLPADRLTKSLKRQLMAVTHAQADLRVFKRTNAYAPSERKKGKELTLPNLYGIADYSESRLEVHVQNGVFEWHDCAKCILFFMQGLYFRFIRFHLYVRNELIVITQSHFKKEKQHCSFFFA